MLDDIKYDFNDLSNCKQRLIEMVMKSYNRDSSYLILDSWGFDYILKKENSNLTYLDRILPWGGYTTLVGRGEACTYAIEKYSGLRLSSYKIINMFEFILQLEKEFDNGLPVILYVDAYWCHWSPFYKKRHIDHFVLAVGYDKNNKAIRCMDASFSKGYESLEINENDRRIESYMTFQFMDNFENAPSFSELANYIADSYLYQNQEKNCVQAMKNFASDVQNNMEFVNEVKNSVDSNMLRIPIFISLVQIGSYRITLSQFLKEKYYKEFGGDVIELFDDIGALGGEWKKLATLIVKLMFQDNTENSLNKIHNKINSMAIQEYNSAVRLLEFVKLL